MDFFTFLSLTFVHNQPSVMTHVTLQRKINFAINFDWWLRLLVIGVYDWGFAITSDYLDWCLKTFLIGFSWLFEVNYWLIQIWIFLLVHWLLVLGVCEHNLVYVCLCLGFQLHGSLHQPHKSFLQAFFDINSSYNGEYKTFTLLFWSSS